MTDAYGAGGGIAQYNRDLLTALGSADGCAAIAVLARNGALVQAGLPARVQQLGIADGKAAFLWQALSALWRLPRVDVVFCGHLFMLPLAVLLARLAGARVWLQLHGIEAWTRPGPLLRSAVGHVHLVTAVSRHTRRLFLQWADCPPDRVRVLPNTVGEQFVPGPVPAQLQARFNTQGKRVLLTVSRLSAAERYKGHDCVLEALAQLRTVRPELLYLIAGEGDGRPQLAALARQLRLEDQVRFIGHVADAELPDLYRLADVFVMPSTGEGFGIVFLQALMCGTPAIAADADGSRDPLRDGVAGVLVSLQEPGSLAGALAQLPAGGSLAAAAVFCRANFNRHALSLLAGLRAQRGTVSAGSGLS